MKNAFIDEEGILIAYGQSEIHGTDEKIQVPDNFDKEPGKWVFREGKWTPLAKEEAK